jgi:hypothetical protein
MGRFSGFLRLPQQGHIYAVSSIYSSFSYLMLRIRSLTKICDQIIALLSSEHSTTIVWNDEESDTESVDVSTCEFDRVYSFEVTETNEQEESAVSYPGFQVPFLSVCAKPHLTYLRWTRVILYTMRLLLAISAIPQPLLLVFCEGKLRKGFLLCLTSHLKFMPRIIKNTRLTGYASRSYCKCA